MDGCIDLLSKTQFGYVPFCWGWGSAAGSAAWRWSACCGASPRRGSWPPARARWRAGCRPWGGPASAWTCHRAPPPSAQRAPRSWACTLTSYLYQRHQHIHTFGPELTALNTSYLTSWVYFIVLGMNSLNSSLRNLLLLGIIILVFKNSLTTISYWT